MQQLQSRHLFNITIDLHPILDLGKPPAGHRRIVPVSGGRCGVRHSSEDVAQRIARGENVPSSDYYLRTVPFFETAAPAYDWLNRIVAVGIGERLPNGASYDVFEIL